MQFLLDNDVDRPSAQQYPVSELVLTYLQQTRSVSFGPGADPRERSRASRAQDLWDYLGDFA